MNKQKGKKHILKLDVLRFDDLRKSARSQVWKLSTVLWAYTWCQLLFYELKISWPTQLKMEKNIFLIIKLFFSKNNELYWLLPTKPRWMKKKATTTTTDLGAVTLSTSLTQLSNMLGSITVRAIVTPTCQQVSSRYGHLGCRDTLSSNTPCPSSAFSPSQCPLLSFISLSFLPNLHTNNKYNDILLLFYLFYSRLCPSTAGCSPPPESNFLCPLLSLSIPLSVASQCHLFNDVLVFQLILNPLSATLCFY